MRREKPFASFLGRDKWKEELYNGDLGSVYIP